MHLHGLSQHQAVLRNRLPTQSALRLACTITCCRTFLDWNAWVRLNCYLSYAPGSRQKYEFEGPSLREMLRNPQFVHYDRSHPVSVTINYGQVDTSSPFVPCSPSGAISPVKRKTAKVVQQVRCSGYSQSSLSTLALCLGCTASKRSSGCKLHGDTSRWPPSVNWKFIAGGILFIWIATPLWMGWTS